jgi:hypothetical protein
VWVARNPPGFAYVEYEDERDAEEAIKSVPGTIVAGVALTVEFAQSSGPKPRGSFRGDDRRGGGGYYDDRRGGAGGYDDRRGGGYDDRRRSPPRGGGDDRGRYDWNPGAARGGGRSRSRRCVFSPPSSPIEAPIITTSPVTTVVTICVPCCSRGRGDDRAPPPSRFDERAPPPRREDYDAPPPRRDSRDFDRH